MKSDSGGTVTAIFMLIPLVAVPYFAIRGTADIQGRLPSLTGEDVAFASTDGFEETSASMDDAPPFPAGESVVVNGNETGTEEGDWGDPFESNGNNGDSGSGGIDFGGTDANSLDTVGRRLRSGLGGAEVRPGFPGATPASPETRVSPASGSKTTKLTVAEQWESGIRKLKSAGMRNYRVESLRDKSMYFVTAFFPGQDGVMRRFEGEGKHPLDALRSVMRQVTELRDRLPR